MMELTEDEEQLLRKVALENSRSILLARNRAEADLVRAKESLERKTAELAHSLAMMRATLESTTDAILVTDGAGRVTDFNEKFVAMWGLSPELIESRDHRRIIESTSKLFAEPGPFIDRVGEIYRSALAESDDLLQLEDGRVYERFSRIQFVDDQNVGRVWSFRDITERTQLEAIREQSTNELRQLAASLSGADRRKNEFLAMLAHELRNPLAPIRNALQVMRLSGANGQSVQAASEMIDRQVSQLVRLVDDLMDVSRISRGKIELRRETITLSEIIRQAEEAARPSCESGGVTLEISMPGEPIIIAGDRDRLVQVIGNLLNNSCKFTDSGGRISLTLEQHEDAAVIKVNDTGIGLSADEIPYIFDIFVQADTSLERAGSGLGIGLTLVRNLVEMHGGSVEAASDGLGKGSEFVVRIPLAALSRGPLPEAAVDLDSSKDRALRILVVDDNIDSAESMAMILQLTGHQVEMAFDGAAAIETAEKFRPDAVLLDIGLPKLNGYEAAKEMRRHQWGKEMVIIALTGWGQIEDRERSSEAGFDDHFVKPVDHGALLNRLEELARPE